MASYNRIIIVGNLTRDPDFKQLASGSGVCQLGVASNRQYRNKQTGNMVQEVCFVDVDVFGPQAESCKQFLQKGRPVLVEGRLKFDSWESPDGQKRSKHTIVADRVVFLAAAGAGEVEAGVRQEENDYQTSTKQEFSAARNSTPKKTAKKSTTASSSVEYDDESADERSSTTGELSFSDEPPFQDDLPF